MPTESGSDDKEQISRRGFGKKVAAAVGGALAAGLGIEEAIRRSDKAPDHFEGQPGKPDLAAQDRKEMATEMKDLEAQQATFQSKFGFPAELVAPERLKASTVSNDYEKTGVVSNEWLYFVKHAASLLQRINTDELFAGLKTAGAKKWKIPVEHTPNTEGRDKIFDNITQALKEKDPGNKKRLLQEIGFEF